MPSSCIRISLRKTSMSVLSLSFLCRYSYKSQVSADSFPALDVVALRISFRLCISLHICFKMLKMLEMFLATFPLNVGGFSIPLEKLLMLQCHLQHSHFLGFSANKDCFFSTSYRRKVFDLAI